MIGSTAFALVWGWLLELYTYATTTIIINFAGFSLSLFELWSSLTVLILILDAILGRIFDDGRSIVRPRRSDDDTY